MSQARSKDFFAVRGGARRSGAEASRPQYRRDCLPPSPRQSSIEAFHGFLENGFCLDSVSISDRNGNFGIQSQISA
jgi:hypothetical protein